MSTLEAQLLKGISSTGTVGISCIRLSDNGDSIYVTGGFSGTLDIGNGVKPIITNSIKGSGFIAEYSNSFKPISLKPLVGTTDTDTCRGNSIALSNSGIVYVTGNFTGKLDIGNGVPFINTNSIESSGFLAEYSNINGLTPIRLKYLGGTKDTDKCICNSIALSNSGIVYVTGGFRGTLDIGGDVPSIIINSINFGGFIAEYSNINGLTPIGLKSLADTKDIGFINSCIGRSIAVSNSGRVYVTGEFNGTLDIGNDVPSITTNGIQSGFIAEYSSINSLTPIGLKYLGGTTNNDDCISFSIALSNSDHVYVTGRFGGTLNIGDGVKPIINSNNASGFVAEYSNIDGLRSISLKSLGGTKSTDRCFCYSIAVSNSGTVYVTGEFTGTLDIGGGVPNITTNSIENSSFIAEYNNDLTPNSLKYLGGTKDTDRCAGNSIALSNTGILYVAGGFIGTLNIGDGVKPIINSNNASGFIAVYTTIHNEPICLVAGTPIVTDQGTIPIENIDTAIHTIGNKAIIALTKAITPEKHLICFEAHSLAINCPTKRTIMTPGHEVLYRGKMVQAKNFLGKLDKVRTVPYDGKKVYNILQGHHGLMVVNNMILETLHPENRVAKNILKSI
jgi:hypothetical protein